MENGGSEIKRWRFKGNEGLSRKSRVTIRGMLHMLNAYLDSDDTRPVVPLSHGDPSSYPSFATTPFAEDSICTALRSGKFNGYPPSAGVPDSRRAVAEYLSKDLPYKLSPDNVYLTIGCSQAMEAIITVVARTNANILLPRPGFPNYETRCAFSHLEARHYDLIPENDWEVDLAAVEALADENTVAMVVINPGNPCGNSFKYEHLKKIAETARKLGIIVISDEVYGHLTFGNYPFVPMGVFRSITPVVTLGSISKRWLVPGWRLGWLVAYDPDGVLAEQGILNSINGFMDTSPDPTTFVQGAASQILLDTPSDFFPKVINKLREAAEICYDHIKEIPFLSCPSKPEASMFTMVKLNLFLLNGIEDDIDFCVKLAKEESVVILPGTAVGLKNWLRITFAIEPSLLDDGFVRVKEFCKRYSA